MNKEEAAKYLIDISYKLGNMSIVYLTEKDGEKMRKAIEVLKQEGERGEKEDMRLGPRYSCGPKII